MLGDPVAEAPDFARLQARNAVGARHRREFML